MQKERELQQPVKEIINKLNEMMQDVCVLEIKDNRASVTRIKKALSEVENDIYNYKKNYIDTIRKSIDNAKKENKTNEDNSEN